MVRKLILATAAVALGSRIVTAAPFTISLTELSEDNNIPFFDSLLLSLPPFEPQIIPAENVIQLTRHTPEAAKKDPAIDAAFRRRKIQRRAVGNFTESSNIIPFQSESYGLAFSSKVQIGGQTITLIMDTGSADTWIVGSGFQCYDYDTGRRSNQSTCAFGKPYYVPTTTFNTSIIQNINLNVSYGSGEEVTGIFGFDTVSIGGLSVRQQIATVDQALWNGDSITTGIMGLAQRLDTSAFAGSDPSQDGPSTQAIKYDPILVTMFKTYANLSNTFSVALARPSSGLNSATQISSGGVMALGGVPPTSQVSYSNNFATTPLVPIEEYVQAFGPAFNGPVSEYPITVQRVSLNVSGRTLSSNGSFTAIIDTGTSLALLPGTLAADINSLFSPAARLNRQTGEYTVSCTATAPKLGFQIGNQLFTINPADMILAVGANRCISGIGANSDSFGILGDTFLKNVLAVFRLDTSTMSFAQRT